MARRVRLSLVCAVCLALAGGAAWILVRADAEPTASAPLLAAQPNTAATPPPTLVAAPRAPSSALRRTGEPATPLATPLPAPNVDPTPARSPSAGRRRNATTGRVVDPRGRPIGQAVLTPSAPGAKHLRDQLANLSRRARKRVLAELRRGRKKRWRVRSSGDGSFVLPNVPASGLLQVAAAGFVSTQIPLAAPRQNLRIVLRRSRRHAGTVVSAEDLSPIPEARVLAQATNWRAIKHTDPLGRFSVDYPADETLWLLVSAKERVSKVWKEQDPPAVELARGRGVTGRVLQATPQGLRPASDLRVWILGATQKASPPQRERVQADGSFALEGGIDPREEFTVVAFDHRYASPLELKWQPAGADGVTVLLEPRGEVELHNGPSRGSMIPEPVEGIPGVSPNPSVASQSPQRGHAIWSRLAPGQYQFAHDGVRVGLAFKVEAGRTTHVRWKSRASAKPKTQTKTKTKAAEQTPGKLYPVTVRVLDNLGRPVFGATVTSTRPTGTPATATTNPRGEARLKLTAGRTTLRAQKDGLFLERPVNRDPRTTRGPLTLRLVPRTTLRGKLQPPGAATLTLQDDQGKTIATTEATSGAFQFPRLVPGSYTLEIKRGELTSAVKVEVPSPELVVKIE